MMRTHRLPLLGSVLASALMAAHTDVVSPVETPSDASETPETGTETGTGTTETPAPAPEKAKRTRKTAEKKAKTPKKAVEKAVKAPPKPDYLIEKVRKLLTAAEVTFNPRTGIEKLVALAEANEVDISSALRATGSIVPAKYKAIYGAKGNNGDEIADAFAAMKDEKTGRFPEGTLEEVAERNGVDFAKWAHLNQGQQRMNLGNVLRAKKVAGEAIQIGKVKFKAAA